jgi:molybdenum cofactor guanylyltransferase
VPTVPPSGPPPYDAVVLAGGAGRRLGGLDKAALRVGGASLLDRLLSAVPDARAVVVVGPERPTARPVTWTREQPPGTGPAAAVSAGLDRVTAPSVVVLATDLPFLDAAAVRALREAALGRDGALLADDAGREQWLAGCWATAALRDAVARRGDLAGRPVRVLLSGLDRALVRLAPDGPPPWLDCDTPDQLRIARERA